MNLWEFIDKHPVLTVILALIIASAVPSFGFSWKRETREKDS